MEMEMPLHALNLQVAGEAIERVLRLTSGHPQLLQHILFILVAGAAPSTGPISCSQVQAALERLEPGNTLLENLRQDIGSDSKLKSLLTDILQGQQRSFYSYKHYAISGAGAIKNQDSYCMVRNPLFEIYLHKILSLEKRENDLYRNEPFDTIKIDRI